MNFEGVCREESDDDFRNLVVLSWGQRPGKVVSVLRTHLGLDILTVNRMMKEEHPVVTSGTMGELYSILCALEAAGAKVSATRSCSP